MASTSVTCVVQASPEAAGDLIGSFHALPGRPEAVEVRWSGRFVPEGERRGGRGSLRHIHRDGLEALATAIETR
ncbi:hypothetical protein [Streptomyces carpinensis]|uniref:hypothetical protein n=1 Tax=Streptomyces carpinensis TaxID=66369 RepID=UPI000D19E041|nr:hypothetical protein [Streptomyces carpinensis]